MKRIVDDILTELAKDKQVSQLYEKWCELERLKYKIYTQREPELPSLADNKVFKPVKNMIIRAVLDMQMPEPSQYSVPQNDDSDDTAFSDIDNDIFTWSDEDAVEIEVESIDLHIKWSKDYKRACKLYYKKDATDDEKKEAVTLLHSEAEKGNVLAIHDLGKVYADDKEKSDVYYKQALDGFLELEQMSQKLQPYLQYRIPVIAEQSRIPMSNLKWYAAFHDTTHHPHIHLIVYSTNPKQRYLSREGIDKIRSAFANDIFHDDLQSINNSEVSAMPSLISKIG